MSVQPRKNWRYHHISARHCFVDAVKKTELYIIFFLQIVHKVNASLSSIGFMEGSEEIF